MLLAASVLPSRGLLASDAREKGVVVRPLGGLRVSEPGVCCDTGHRMGVDMVDAARSAPCATGRAMRVMGYPRASGTWSVERGGGGVDVRQAAMDVRCLCERAGLEGVCVCGLQPRVSTLCRRRLRVGACAPPSAVVTPPASSGSSAKAPEARRLGARRGGEVPGAPLSRSEIRARCTGARVCVRVHGWGVASELAGVAVRGSEGELEVEGVPGAAACSLLTLGVLFSSPSSRAADAACASCSAV